MSEATEIEAAEDANTLAAKFEELLEDLGIGSNPDDKEEIEAAKRLFFAGARAFMECLEAMRPVDNTSSTAIVAAQRVESLQAEVLEFFEEDEDVVLT